MRSILLLAKEAGYTFIRVWGGGLLEDQYFYELADEFGFLVQQDFPIAGCSEPQASPAIMKAWHMQVPEALSQLMNHPSICRYTFGNEFYMNASSCPLQKQFQDDIRALDDTRMAREADPTGVGRLIIGHACYCVNAF